MVLAPVIGTIVFWYRTNPILQPYLVVYSQTYMDLQHNTWSLVARI